MSEEPPRLKSSVRVAAMMRRLELEGAAVYLRRRGDADAGVILVKVARSAAEVVIYGLERGVTGALLWQPIRAGLMTETEAEEWFARRVTRDPDLWLLEVEDIHGRFRLDWLG